MTGTAICAVWLAILREFPLIAFVIGPLIGAGGEDRNGGRGLEGGVIGGMITSLGLGLFELIAASSGGWVGQIGPAELKFIIIVYAYVTVVGAATGFAEGVLFCLLRYLATLPKQFRLRAERSAKANSNRRTPGTG